MRETNIVIVGATGAVGQVLLQVLAERQLPVGSLRLCASSRSVGKQVSFNGRTLTVEETTPATFRGADIVFISVSSAVSLELGPQAVAAGALVIDDSSAFRMRPEVPLVVPEVNGDDLSHHQGIISIPNCVATPVVMSLWPLHKTNPLQRVIVDSYQAVSGTGKRAVEELRQQSQQVLHGETPKPQVYPHPIAFNLFPQVESFLEDGYSQEERKLIQETRKIMHAPDLAISATCVRVPVMVGHAEAIHAQFTRPMSPKEARTILSAFPGVQVVDSPARSQYPTPLMAAGNDAVLVGRIRQDVSHPNGLALWAVTDNLRKGAATNMVQVAEELLRRNLLLRQRQQG